MTDGREVSPLLRTDGFVWAAGIEDTIIGRPLRGSGRVLDEYVLTQHDRNWQADLDRAASLGIQAIRYGIPWHRVHPGPDRFDWRPVEEILRYAVEEKGLTVIVDLVHYGTPNWLPHAFVDPDFPMAMAAYAGAFARRFKGIISHYTPLNEPLVTASFCGQRGLWPPYLTGDAGWARVILGIAAGITAAIAAIRTADSDAVIVHVEAAKLLRSHAEVPAQDLEVERERAYLATDLVLGRVNAGHPLAGFLAANGISRADLRPFLVDPPAVDAIGVNYYPDLSPREIVLHEGRHIEVAYNAWDDGLVEVLMTFWRRYSRPLLVSETSIEGDDASRIAWFDASVAAVSRLRSEGVPVRGYVWWPLFDFVDWAYASGGETVVEEFWVRTVTANGDEVLAPVAPPGSATDGVAAFLRRMGIWALAEGPDATLDRIETGLAHYVRAVIAGADRIAEERPIQRVVGSAHPRIESVP